MVLSPAESAEFVMKNAKHVSISTAALDEVAYKVLEALRTGALAPSNFANHQYHPKPSDPRAPNWLLLLDTLNFCFWRPTLLHQEWLVNGEHGYFALCAAIHRALENGIDITNPAFYADISELKLKCILRADDYEVVCPMLKYRVQCLQEVGTKLVADYGGDFANVVRKAAGSAVRLMRLIVDEFPCFRDEAEYAGVQISLYKRAQILVGDLWACYGGEGLGRFEDIGEITMFADYRVPQVLHRFGVLQYSAELLEELRRDTRLVNGCAMEVEIRAGSIAAVERLKPLVHKELAVKCPNVDAAMVNSVLLDHFLWDYRRKFADVFEDEVPFHKCISIYY